MGVLSGALAQKDRERLPNRRSRSEGGRMEPKGFGPNRTVTASRSNERGNPIKKATLTKSGERVTPGEAGYVRIGPWN